MINRMTTWTRMLKMMTVICNFDSRVQVYDEQISCCEKSKQGICSLRLLSFSLFLGHCLISKLVT